MSILLLLNSNGTPKCRKLLSSTADQSTIVGDGEGSKFKVNEGQLAANMQGDGVSANAGKFDLNIHSEAPLSGKGTAADKLKVANATSSSAGVVALTNSADIPANTTNDTDALTAAAAAKMLRGIKPVGVSGGASAEQSSHGIEVPMFYNVSCNGGTGGSPKFDIPMAGGGVCTVDVGAWGGSTGPYTPGQIVFSGSYAGCMTLPAGVYHVTFYTGSYSSFNIIVLGAPSSNSTSIPDCGGYVSTEYYDNHGNYSYETIYHTVVASQVVARYYSGSGADNAIFPITQVQYIRGFT